MFSCLVLKTAVADNGASFIFPNMWEFRWLCPKRSRILLSIKEMVVISPHLGPENCLDQGFLLREARTVVWLVSSCSKFRKFVCPLISWDSIVAWHPLRDYSLLFENILELLHKAKMKFGH